MKLRAVINLDAITVELSLRRGMSCSYCNVLHPTGQCLKPVNWSAEAPVRSSTAVFLADEAGSLERYNRQLERQIERDRVLGIKP